MGESGTAGHQQEQKPVALEQLTCEPQIGSSMPDALESMDCNLGTQLTVQQEIQIANGAPPSLISDMSYLQDKVPKGQQRKPSGERPFSCGQCGKCYHRSTDLAKHERAHTAKKTYMCNICGKNFHRNMALLIHARIHTGERPYQCTQCGKRFVQSQHLTTHQRTHTGEKPFQCKECGKGFQCRSEFILHQKNHTEKGSVTFDDVAVRFSEEEWKDLEKHKKELYRDVMMENYQTLISLGFVTHKPEIVLKIERGEDPIASTSRGYVFPHSKSSECFLLNEIPNEQTPRMVNLGQPDRSLRKSLTSPVTSGQKVLQSKAGQEVGAHDNNGRSARSRSPGETLRKRACKDKASSKQTLPVGRHQDRTYSCNVCSKTFVRKQYLKIHSRTHTEERPFTCGQCGSSFRQSAALTTHLWSHTGHKPFHCSSCTKTFSRKTDLVAHTRVHTGERPYECHLCLQRFIRKKSLQRHLLKYKEDNTEPASETIGPSVDDTKGQKEREHEAPPALACSALPLQFNDDEQRRSAELLTGPDAAVSEEHVQVGKQTEDIPRPLETDKKHQSTQTKVKRAHRVHQQIQRKLKWVQRNSARTLQEWVALKSSLDQLKRDMREMKETIATLCASNCELRVRAPLCSPGLVQCGAPRRGSVVQRGEPRRGSVVQRGAHRKGSVVSNQKNGCL